VLSWKVQESTSKVSAMGSHMEANHLAFEAT
jgi:hypothetical protein